MSKAYVVDTNVPIAANGANKDISYECRFRCVEFLEELTGSGKLVLDLEGAVEAEYRANLSMGVPGVGNRFLQRFLTEAAARVVRVSLVQDKKGNFVNFPCGGPLKNFDVSDRKFAALSKATASPVAVAVDSDWLHHEAELKKAGVTIEFLCGTQQKSWFISKA
jgi:hypothetical protein